jgi:two-component system copper resistance phosphate regulon response regulator CusR
MSDCIFLIEDNVKLAETLSSGLQEEGFAVTWCPTAASVGEKLCEHTPLLFLLDLGLPDRDGLDLLNDIKESHPDAAVLIITARDGIEARVSGLNLGADDYLVKPFSFQELVARIRALNRRVAQNKTVLDSHGVRMDTRSRTVLVDGADEELPPREFALLAYLIEHESQTVSRETLAKHVWKVSSRATSMDNVIDVHISRLREKLKPYNKERLIHTVRGVGYVFGKS